MRQISCQLFCHRRIYADSRRHRQRRPLVMEGSESNSGMARNRQTKHGTDCMSGQKGQTRSERLAAQILFHESFVDFDPSHPLGGKDGGKDAIATKEGMRFAMAVYFPRGQQTLNAIRSEVRRRSRRVRYGLRTHDGRTRGH